MIPPENPSCKNDRSQHHKRQQIRMHNFPFPENDLISPNQTPPSAAIQRDFFKWILT
jgi:hypothetical protein